MRPTHVLAFHPGKARTDDRAALLRALQGLDLTGDASDFVLGMCEAIASGHSLTVVEQEVELSTMEAADLLGVSRPFLVQLLDRDRIPHRRVGRDRRIAASSLLAYMREQKLLRGGAAASALAYEDDADARLVRELDLDEDAARLLGL